jgi:tripartite-type tricarboxylate transporter receptor subunit TctC
VKGGVNSSVPAKTVPEFIAYAKANPGKLSMASSGIGTPAHVFGELFKFMAGVNLVHVPYRGAAPAVTDLLAGQVQVYFDPISNSIGHIRAKNFKNTRMNPAALAAAGAGARLRRARLQRQEC